MEEFVSPCSPMGEKPEGYDNYQPDTDLLKAKDLVGDGYFFTHGLAEDEKDCNLEKRIDKSKAARWKYFKGDIIIRTKPGYANPLEIKIPKRNLNNLEG